MSNAVTTTTSNQVPGFMNGDNPFLTHSKQEGVTDGLYMRHNGNTGKYILGDQEIDGGAFVFDMWSARLSWLGFDPNNKPVQGPEVRMADNKPLMDPPETLGVKWNKQIKVGIINPETGAEIILTAKADRPTRGIWRLIKAYGQQMIKHPDGAGFKMPLVEVASGSFEMEIEEEQKDGTKRKMKVRKYRDEYKITDWYGIAEVEDLRANASIGDDEGEEEAPMKDVTPAAQEIIPPKAPSAPATGRSRFGSR